jgi:hypothetical protein
MLSIPTLASVNLLLGPGLFRALVGPSLDWSRLVTTTSLRTITDTLVSVGLAAGASYGILLGPGALGLEIRYRLTSVAADGRAYPSSAIIIGMSYVLTP